MIKDGIELLKNGYFIVIFFEGMRSKGGEVGEFKVGSFYLVVKLGVVILFVILDGIYKMFEVNGNCMKLVYVIVIIFKLIIFEDYVNMDIKELMKYI